MVASTRKYGSAALLRSRCALVMGLVLCVASAPARAGEADPRALALREYTYAACLQAYYEVEAAPPPRGKDAALRWKQNQLDALARSPDPIGADSYAIARMEALGIAHARAHPEAYAARSCRVFSRGEALAEEVDATLAWHQVERAGTPDVVPGPALALPPAAEAEAVADALVGWRVAKGRLRDDSHCTPVVDYFSVGERALGHARESDDAAHVEAVLYLAARLRAEAGVLEQSEAGWRLVDDILNAAEESDSDMLRQMLSAYRPRPQDILRALSAHARCRVATAGEGASAPGSDDDAALRQAFVSRIERTLEAVGAESAGDVGALWDADEDARHVRQILATDARLDAYLAPEVPLPPESSDEAEAPAPSGTPAAREGTPAARESPPARGTRGE